MSGIAGRQPAAKSLRSERLLHGAKTVGVSVAFASVVQLLMRLPHNLRTARRGAWLRVAALCLLVAFLSGWHFDRLSPERWSYPTDYSGDAMEVLARIKAASEGDLIPFTRQIISRLGAPFGTDWSEYPAPDGLLIFLLGQLARGIGVGGAANVAVLLAQVTAALSFYLCARWLRQRWEWAFAGALLFSFAFHSVFRGLSHLSLIYTWTAPPALLLCALVARSRRLTLRSSLGWLCLALAVALALSNPYNLFLFLQLLAWALVAQWFGQRRVENLMVGVACGLLALAVLTAVLLPTRILPAAERGLPLLARNYGGTELYALKPIEMLLPPSMHRSELLAALGDRYLRWSDLRGEAFSPYLGVVGGVGLIGLFVAAAVALFRRRRLPEQVLPAAWILAFSAVGGVNSLLAFYAGLQVFRATNRYSIFLFALALGFVVARLSHWSRRVGRRWSYGAAALVAVVGLWDQLPRSDPRPEAAIALVRRDRDFGAILERELPPGAMLFQLPYIEFPEGKPRHEFFEYEHFRPYLATTTIRFTFGARKHRARSQWQRDFESLPPERLVPALEQAGFAGIYLNRRAYLDRGEGLLAALRAQGRAEVIEGRAREQVVVRLKSVDTIRMPIALEPTFGLGWNPPEPDRQGVRWSTGDASIAYYNPSADPLPARIRFDLAAVGPRQARLALNGEEILRVFVHEDPQVVDLPAVELAPGLNRLDFTTDEPATRQGRERNRLRSLLVSQLRIELPDDPDLLKVGRPPRNRRSAPPGQKQGEPAEQATGKIHH